MVGAAWEAGSAQGTNGSMCAFHVTTSPKHRSGYEWQLIRPPAGRRQPTGALAACGRRCSRGRACTTQVSALPAHAWLSILPSQLVSPATIDQAGR